MGNLGEDTAVEAGDGPGRYRAKLSADWAIWGPNGGYLAAVALRAAGAGCGLDRPRPASFLCHYLGVASFDEVDLAVAPLRAAKRAESVRVTMSQGGNPVLEALIWTVADGLDGLDHDAAPAPEAPPPGELPSVEDLLPADAPPRYKFWGNLEERPVGPFENWETRKAGDPRWLGWMRFRPEPCFDDPFVDAGRLAILVDTFQWPAATRAYDGGSLQHIAPSLDLACRFHRRPLHEPWLLVEARSPVAEGGLVAGTAAVWDTQGRLLASGGQQMLSRPVTPAHAP
jgi:acyl-CoA thioesterase